MPYSIRCVIKISFPLRQSLFAIGIMSKAAFVEKKHKSNLMRTC